MCVNVLEEPQTQSSAVERHSHTMALQALERQAKEDVLSERNRLQTMHHLELGITHTNTHTLAHIHMHTCSGMSTGISTHRQQHILYNTHTAAWTNEHTHTHRAIYTLRL